MRAIVIHQHGGPEVLTPEVTAQKLRDGGCIRAI